METPSSTTRVTTRSQYALKNINNNVPISRRLEESKKGASKSMKRNGKQQPQDRSLGLIDVSNDSPIVGLAAGNMRTPSSNVAKQGTRNRENMTPGSGEALLRGQVKLLLKKVEQEAEISKISILPGLRFPGGVVKSPFALLAPTPANTPQISNLSDDKISFGSSVSISSSSTVTQYDFKTSQNAEQEDSAESFTITRSLLLDFSNSSSVISYQDIDLKEGKGRVDQEGEEDSVVGALDHEDSSVNELCSEISKMSIARTWAGKHTRFVYNSNDEVEAVEENADADDVKETSVMKLNGLPTPKGKHIRFTEED